MLTQPLNFNASHPNAIIFYYASDMILNIHSNASNLDWANACSLVGGHFSLGWLPVDDAIICLNGQIHVVFVLAKVMTTVTLNGSINLSLSSHTL